jgi:hypothetical protein
MQISEGVPSPLTFMSPLTPSRPAPDALWRALTRQAHRAFADGQDFRARQLYDEALSEAELVFVAAALPGNGEATYAAPVLYNVSCYNVAELARRQRDPHTEGIYIYRAFERLLRAAESRDTLYELRACAVRHLGVAVETLVAYLVQHDLSETANAHAERARLATLEVQDLHPVWAS